MAIQDRKINVGGAGLQNRSQERSVRSLEPSRNATGVSSLARLTSSLGVVIPAIADAKQKEADAEALRIFTEAQIKAKEKDANKDQVFAEARQRVAEGQGRGFFDRLLTDEDESVKVFDSRRADSDFYAMQTEIAEFRANNPDMKLVDLDSGIRGIADKHLYNMESISQSARDRFLDNSRDYLDKLDQSLSAKEFERLKGEQVATIEQGANGLANSKIQELLEMDALTWGSSTTDLNSYNSVVGKLQDSDTYVGIKDNIVNNLEDYRKDLTTKGVVSKQEAGLMKADRAMVFADKLNSLKMFDDIVSTPDKSGQTMEDINPEYVHKLRQKLNSKLQTRSRSMKQAELIKKDEDEKSLADRTLISFMDLEDKVINDPSPQNVTELTSFVNNTRLEAQEQFKKGEISPDQFKSQMKLVDSFEFESRAKNHITRPEVANKADEYLTDLDGGESLADKHYQFFNMNAEHMSFDQAKRFKEKFRIDAKTRTETERLTSNLEAQSLERHKNGLAMNAVSEVWRDVTDPQSLIAKYMGAEKAQFRLDNKIANPPNINIEQMQTLALNLVKERRKVLLDKPGVHSQEYRAMWDKAWLDVTKAKNEELKSWVETLPTSKDDPDVVKDTETLSEIKSGTELEKAITKTVDSFGHNPEKWSDEDKKRMSEDILPQVKRRLIQMDEAREFENATDIGEVIERMFPNLDKTTKSDLHRMGIIHVWSRKLTRDAQNAEFADEYKRTWPELGGRAPESLEEWLGVMKSRPDNVKNRMAIKDIEKQIKERDERK